MLKNKIKFISVAVLATISFTVQAGVNVDGQLSDWINYGSTINTGDWDNTSGTAAGDASLYVVEDHRGGYTPVSKANGGSTTIDGKLYNISVENKSKPNSSGPSGGQAYDAEGMYALITQDTLHLALVTGLAPDSYWKAGDVFFDLNGDVDTTTYNNTGSVGSGDFEHNKFTASGGDGYEYGLVVVNHGGSEDNSPFIDGNSWASGDLYNVTEWNTGSSDESQAHPASGKEGTEVAGTDNSLVYDSTVIPNNHYLIEASISLVGNAFGDSLIQSIKDGTDINFHWNPLCNNDWIQMTLSATGVPTTEVPEPTSLALLTIGFVGMAATRRRRKVS